VPSGRLADLGPQRIQRLRQPDSAGAYMAFPIDRSQERLEYVRSRGSSATMASIAQEHPRADLRDIDSEQRVRDIRIGEVGGLARPRSVQEVIEANRDELLCYGSLPALTAMIEVGKGAQREVQEYWLNEEQSLAVLTLLRTPEGRKARVVVIKTFAAVRRGELQPRRWPNSATGTTSAAARLNPMSCSTRTDTTSP
jgi:hypothetical protein